MCFLTAEIVWHSHQWSHSVLCLWIIHIVDKCYIFHHKVKKLIINSMREQSIEIITEELMYEQSPHGHISSGRDCCIKHMRVTGLALVTFCNSQNNQHASCILSSFNIHACWSLSTSPPPTLVFNHGRWWEKVHTAVIMRDIVRGFNELHFPDPSQPLV